MLCEWHFNCDLFFIFKNVVAYLIRFCIHINIVLHSIIHRVNFFNWKLKKLTFLINFVWEISEFNALNSITKWKKSHHPKKRKTYKKRNGKNNYRNLKSVAFSTFFCEYLNSLRIYWTFDRIVYFFVSRFWYNLCKIE